MKPGWNPIRRNRRIGRKRRERRRDNRFVVPDSRRRQGRSLWERINEPRCVYRDIAGRRFRFLVEKTRHGIVHVCTIDDIAAVLGQVPRPDIEGLRWIVLLQPTRKEEGLEPVWGRMVFEASFGPVVGPALILEAVDTSKPSRWRRPLSIRDRRELERLREDGHDVVATARHYTVGSSLEAVRATQLYHTVFHEIGHWIDWRERVVRRATRERFVFQTALGGKGELRRQLCRRSEKETDGERGVPV